MSLVEVSGCHEASKMEKIMCMDLYIENKTKDKDIH